LPQTFSIRARAASGRTFGAIALSGEIGLDALFPTGQGAPITVGSEINLRGGVSISFRASPYVSIFADLSGVVGLTGGEDGAGDAQDGIDGNKDDSFVLQVGPKLYLGRVTVGGFLAIPQNNPLSDLGHIGVGFDVQSAL